MRERQVCYVDSCVPAKPDAGLLRGSGWDVLETPSQMLGNK